MVGLGVETTVVVETEVKEGGKDRGDDRLRDRDRRRRGCRGRDGGQW